MNLTWCDVKFYVGFPEDRSIDIDSILVEDLDNGLCLRRGENYDVSVGGIPMAFITMNASQIRSFRLNAWDLNATEVLSPPLITCAGKVKEAYGGDMMYMSSGSWTNDYGLPYHGTAFVSIDIDSTMDPATIVVFDVVHNRELSSALYPVAGNTLILSSDAVGLVPVGGTREYEVYFETRLGDATFGFFSPLVTVGGYGISLYWISAAAVVGLALVARSRMTKDNGYLVIGVAVGVFAFVGMHNLEGITL